MRSAPPSPDPDVPDPDAPPRAQDSGRLWSLWVLVGLTCLPEIVLTLADQGLLGSVRWRSLAYQNGAFWAGLLQGWRPNYAAQPVTMFLSYAVLHAGPAHLGRQHARGWSGSGGSCCRGSGSGRFLLLYLGAAVGGAGLFGLMSTSPAPMVGASGALFGLAGAWIVQEGRLDLRPLTEGGAGRGRHGSGWARCWAC
jgi:rhomboid protease GluP